VIRGRGYARWSSTAAPGVVDDDAGMAIPAWARQDGGSVRFEWGPAGVRAVAAPYVVVVDVLRFTTAVDAAVGRGARVYPYRWNDISAVEFAGRTGAALAGSADPAGPSLSPVRLSQTSAGDAIVLPSPNGSTCAAIAASSGATVLAACLRNAEAVANWLDEQGGAVTVIACGEQWPDGSLRPCIEDHLGAGAVVSLLRGEPSPEARGAAAAWFGLRPEIEAVIRHSASGQELHARGCQADVDYALEVGESANVPILVDGAFVDAASV
jgi:2-phosphosulfolactate phosphatase